MNGTNDEVPHCGAFYTPIRFPKRPRKIEIEGIEDQARNYLEGFEMCCWRIFVSRINPIPHIDTLRSILILSSHLRLVLPNGLFPVGLPVNILKALLS